MDTLDRIRQQIASGARDRAERELGKMLNENPRDEAACSIIYRVRNYSSSLPQDPSAQQRPEDSIVPGALLDSPGARSVRLA